MRSHKASLDVNGIDRLFYGLVRFSAVGIALLLAGICVQLAFLAWPAIQAFGVGFLAQNIWDPVHRQFGALALIFGTVVSSLLALILSLPVSMGVALFLTEIAPASLARVIGFLVEMLAAIPSVVYGLWGIFVLCPWLRTQVQPFFSEYLGFLPFFQGPSYGVGLLSAALILAIMITPTITSISREVFLAVPRSQREAALALGATRWEMMRLSVLRSARSGLLGAMILGLGRALGETMAVTMVIGNRAQITASLFAPAQTMASAIANEYVEATDGIHAASLVYLGLCLFLVSFLVNAVARACIWGLNRNR